MSLTLDQELSEYLNILGSYRKLFEQDGVISPDEQVQLNAIEDKINQLRVLIPAGDSPASPAPSPGPELAPDSSSSSRVVAGAGGYEYEQHANGDIFIVKGPSGSCRTQVKAGGTAYNAIVAEIGPFPSGGGGDGGGTTPMPAEPAPESPVGDGSGKITGKSTGVKSEIIAFVQAVADFYGATININSGLRTPTEQGETMYEYWVNNLERGDIYSKIKNDPALKELLNDLYDKAQAGDASAKKQFVDKIASEASSYSRHVSGQAIDIPKDTPNNIRDALKTGLREVSENLCYHYDNQEFATPKVTDAIRAKWTR